MRKEEGLAQVARILTGNFGKLAGQPQSDFDQFEMTLSSPNLF